MSRLAGTLLAAVCGCIPLLFAGLSTHAAESTRESASVSETAEPPDLFEAEERGLVGVRYIPNDAKSAQVIISNRTRRPLTLRLPASFVGVPVLAQMGMGGMGGGGQAGFAAGGIGGGPQTTGGGMRGGQLGGQGMNGMGGGGVGMGGGGAFSIPPERTRVVRVTTVCLEYGKREPTSRMPYRLRPASSFSSDPKVVAILASLGRGELPQKVAQAAAWHLANGLSWEQLAAEKIDRAGGTPDEPYFSPADLLAARGVVAAVTRESARPQGTTLDGFASQAPSAQ